MASSLGADSSQAPATQTSSRNVMTTPLDNHDSSRIQVQTKREDKRRNRKINRLRRIIGRQKTTINAIKAEVLQKDSRMADWWKQISQQRRTIAHHEETATQVEKVISNQHERAQETTRKLTEMSQRARLAENQVVELKMSYKNISQKFATEINKLKTHNQKLSAQIADRNSARSKARALANSSKVSDDAILQIWRKMKYAIQNLAATLLTECPSADDIDYYRKNSHSVVGGLTQRNFKYLQDVDMRSSAVEHLLWGAVNGRVFGPDRQGCFGRIWAGPVGVKFSSIVNELGKIAVDANVDGQALFRWKAEGSKMIEDMVGIDKTQLDKVVRIESRAFSCFLSKSDVQRQDATDKLHNSLQRIFEDAWDLHSIFMKSKANIFTKWPTSQYGRFDPESMEAESWEKEPVDKSSIVMITLSPGLVKVGTADGDRYDQTLQLAKARVVCN